MASKLLVRIAPLLLVTPFILVACVSHRVIDETPTSASATSAPQDPDDFIYSFLTRGKYYLIKGNPTEAIQEFKRAYNSLKPDSPISLRGIVLNDLGEALIVAGNYKEAIPVCHSALLINLSCKNKIESAISHMNLGDAIGKKGNTTDAKAHWKMAYEIASQMGHAGLIKSAQSRPIATTR